MAEVSPADVGNDLLAETPAVLVTTEAQLPDGRRMLLATIRTPSVTLSVFLPKQAAIEWGEQLVRDGNAMTQLVAVPRL